MTWIDPVCGVPVDVPQAPRTTANTVEDSLCSTIFLHTFQERMGRSLNGDPRLDQIRGTGSAEPEGSRSP